VTLACTTTAAPEIHYPDSDGKPLGETGWHVNTTLNTFGLLERRYAGRPDVYVAANMFLYYEEGNPKANRSPDCMVIMGARGNHPRRSFKTWIEGAVPAVVFEFASPETYREDLGVKRDIYARLGVTEYFLFDPIGECLDPRLQGFRLGGQGYQELTAGDDGALISQVLNLRLVPEGSQIRLIDLETGRILPTSHEISEAYDRIVEQDARIRQRAEELAAEVERLRARLAQRDRPE